MNHSLDAVPQAHEVRDQLERILRSPLFSTARRLSQFLEYVVSASHEGAETKEILIGVEVYGRDPSYNPKLDSIVRAEASRLRSKLREYYETEGAADPIRIELPKGTYNPVFRSQLRVGAAIALDHVPSSEPPPAAGTWARWVWLLAGILIFAITGAWWIRSRGLKLPSIAIMRVANLQQDRSLEALAESVTGEITAALVASKQWRVKGRAPDLDLTGKDQMLAPLRDQLGAQVVLTGSLRTGEQSTVRLDLQLLNVSDGYLLWTGTYHNRLTPLIESQGDFARRIVEDLTQRFTRQALPPRSAPYSRARELWSSYSREGLEQSLLFFREAIRADSGFAPAWAGLADAQSRLADDAPELDTSARVAAAREAALKAITIDDSNAEAHAVLGRIYLLKDWNFRAAVQQLHRAVVLDPLRVWPNAMYSMALSVVGDLAGAEEAIRSARARLPGIPDLVFQEGSIFFLAHKFEKMESIGRELIVLAPDRPSGRWLLGLALELRGNTTQAMAEFENGLRETATDDTRILCALSHSYARAGNRKLALETMRRYLDPEEGTTTRFTLSYCAALTYTALNQKDQAFEWLEKARDGHDYSFPFFTLDPRFDSLRSDPRYGRLAAWLKDRTGSPSVQ